ncbi:6-pyruvoyl-tetrahydropterin synthase-related protein [Clostridium paraputrificum]|uniref:6-pyruvoyl-tetrahydropterin synthase-related protein n=1 Tax=Clostridium paraputrificum TaxID=29363 RepID=UPI003D339398
MAILIKEEDAIEKEEKLNRKVALEERRSIQKAKRIQLMYCAIILVIASIITIININKSGTYPWGSDTFGHLFKGNILYDTFREGNIFNNFNSAWYNGVQIFRYSEPITYYLIAFINLFTNNIFITFNVFIVFVFIVGGFGFLLWGYHSERQKLGLFLGIMWFFIPNNLRVLFAEGNLPLTIINMLIPYLFLVYYYAMKENRGRNYLLLALLIAVITLTNASLAIMILLFLFTFNIIDAIRNKKVRKNFVLLGIVVLGVLITSFWLIPAIKGGLLNMSKSEVSQVMDRSTYIFSQSLNPLLRFSNIEVYYFGLSFVFISIFGIIFSYKGNRVRGLFITSILILIGTHKVLLPVLKEIPISQFMFIIKITGIAIALVFAALLFWKNLRKSLLLLICFIISLDSMMSFEGLGVNREFPEDISNSIEIASEMAVQRIGILDASDYGSFPSYYISYINDKNIIKQIFGWEWHGAETASNIININTSLENNYFATMFDRSLELGADTLVIKKSFIKDFNDLDYWADKVGYEKRYEDEKDIIYKYPIEQGFGTKVTFDAIGIGEYASNIIYNFPDFTIGDSTYIDDYNFDELKGYKSIFLSGFKYRNKNNAEKLVKDLSEYGVRVVLDIRGMDESGFLGVVPQLIDLKKSYGDIYYKGNKVELGDFPEELYDFRCEYIIGAKEENIDSYSVIETKVLDYLSYYNENLVFLGLNLPYYATMTKDKVAINILEDLLNKEANVLPKRQVVKVDINFESDKRIMITSEESGVVTSLACLDTFRAIKGDFSRFNNLVVINENEVLIEIGYPNEWIGQVLSIVAIISLLVIIRSTQKGRLKRYLDNESRGS